MAFKYFDFDRTWWRLLQKRNVHTKLDLYLFIMMVICLILLLTIDLWCVETSSKLKGQISRNFFTKFWLICPQLFLSLGFKYMCYISIEMQFIFIIIKFIKIRKKYIIMKGCCDYSKFQSSSYGHLNTIQIWITKVHWKIIRLWLTQFLYGPPRDISHHVLFNIDPLLSEEF